MRLMGVFHRAPSGVGCDCRTRQQNAHVTERREVLYPWHPWFGLSVQVHQTVNKGLNGTFRCGVDGVSSGRWLELPAWMFDRVACLPMRIATSPQAHRRALAGLQSLLREPTNVPSAIASSRAPDSGAGSDSCHQNWRSADGKPAPRLRETVASSPATQSVRRRVSGASMAASAAGDPVDGDGLDDTAIERASAIRRSEHRGRAVR